jgi:hypothetical protein
VIFPNFAPVELSSEVSFDLELGNGIEEKDNFFSPKVDPELSTGFGVLPDPKGFDVFVKTDPKPGLVSPDDGNPNGFGVFELKAPKPGLGSPDPNGFDVFPVPKANPDDTVPNTPFGLSLFPEVLSSTIEGFGCTFSTDPEGKEGNLSPDPDSFDNGDPVDLNSPDPDSFSIGDPVDFISPNEPNCGLFSILVKVVPNAPPIGFVSPDPSTGFEVPNEKVFFSCDEDRLLSVFGIPKLAVDTLELEIFFRDFALASSDNTLQGFRAKPEPHPQSNVFCRPTGRTSCNG